MVLLVVVLVSETAINIGYSCQLLNDEMELWIVDGHTQDQVEYQLDQCNNSLLGISEHRRSERNSMATSIVRFRFVKLFTIILFVVQINFAILK